MGSSPKILWKYERCNMLVQKNKLKCKVGFTLVELLVVISIIALLLSILMPSLQKARSTAKRIICASNMRQILLGTTAYSVENNGYAPLWTDYHWNNEYSSPPMTYFSSLNYYGYVGEDKVFRCPTRKLPEYCPAAPYNSDPDNWFEPGRAYDDNFRGINNAGYAAYQFLLGFRHPTWTDVAPYARFIELPKVSIIGDAGNQLSDLYKKYHWTTPTYWPVNDVVGVVTPIDLYYSLPHDELANAGVSDGHVETYKYEDLINSQMFRYPARKYANIDTKR